MNDDHIVWGCGRTTADQKLFVKKDISIIPEPFKYPIKKVYFKDDALLTVTINGELFKKGLFNWEKDSFGHSEKADNLNKRREETILIPIKSNMGSELVKKCSIGEDHILILTMNGNVYAWGDNYYGQLGINNNMIPTRYEPQLVKFSTSNSVIEEIYAFKHNSFAIDKDGKLFIWGKEDYLMNRFKGNLFKPTMFLPEYKVLGIKATNDRMVVWGRNTSIFIHSKDEAKIQQFEEENANQEMKEKLKGMTTNVEEVEQIDENLTAIKTVNDRITRIVNKVLQEDKPMKMLREKVLSDKSIIKSQGLIVSWDTIIDILKFANDPSLKKDKNLKFPTIKNKVDTFSSFFNSILCTSQEGLKIKEIGTELDQYDKECEKLFSQASGSNIKDEVVRSLIENNKILMSYFIKYKKTEALVHKMAGHTFLFKSFRFENVLDALKIISDKDENIESKLYLIEKTFVQLDDLIEKFDATVGSIENVYGSIHKKLNMDTDNTAERFLYKHIIESTFYIRDLWKLLMSHLKEERIIQEKITQMNKISSKYKEIYAIQSYVGSLSVTSLRLGGDNNIIEKLTEIDGAIARIELILNENLEGNKNDGLTTELILMYASSVLESAHLKKMLFSMVCSVNSYQSRKIK